MVNYPGGKDAVARGQFAEELRNSCGRLAEELRFTCGRLAGVMLISQCASEPLER